MVERSPDAERYIRPGTGEAFAVMPRIRIGKKLRILGAVVAAFTTLVFAGLERASFSLGYTGLVAAVASVRRYKYRIVQNLAGAFVHPVVLVVVVGATAHDVGGRETVPWFLVVMCWCLAYVVGSNAAFDSGWSPQCAALSVLSFVTGMWQALDSAYSSN